MKLIKPNIAEMTPDGKLPVQPSVIHRALDRKLSGLAEAKRFISTRIALHLRRAVDLSKGNRSPDKNQCILIMGPSGAGKTFLVEQAAMISRIPFVAASAAALTSEGFTGQSLSGVLHRLMKTASSAKVARYGICFLDEWDKRVQQGFDRVGFSQGVQGEVLRMMEGTEVEIETRPVAGQSNPKFNTGGLMFVFAGAFEGLERLMAQQGGKTVTGFAATGEASFKPVQENRVRDALIDYGVLPEFINRLSGILTLPAPTHADMLALLRFGNGPVESCNRRLRGLGTELVLSGEAASDMAKYSCDTKSYCRGIHLMLQAAADYLVYEGVEGQVAIEPGDLKQLVEGKWLKLTPSGNRSAAGEPEHTSPRFMTAA
jgi:ATP-dependent Clp protease ATP-binding subunit ClpX